MSCTTSHKTGYSAYDITRLFRLSCYETTNEKYNAIGNVTKYKE